ncbi:hydrogenase nickel incorporation protein HypA [Anaerocolumna cellulosilytica]|uniref:Hydrogenase maturation factor HypA n=1 Tax=Anaerocolumna cellulosilytica TaxID=433286 RepID=A0A6S6R471_9FIRM|nr:hydrogenase maturation nickel metallochaperone HypA [Anaerocolumna cellulosilytica]MBB5196639.1 hydrogenase nickel incorporation protein HypA/HybF [Anaerocolumna cellulosilytica]BCJ93901.1 hydrogenase nickel incorporation protein HypA [Anaerocolumna cellulosilytica]
MHELGVINSMVHTIEGIIKEQNLTKVHKLVIEVGELSGIVPRYLEQCFPAATYKTFMEKTELELIIIPGIVKCKSCGRVFNAVYSDLSCPDCKSFDMEILEGNDMIIKQIECS